ncbi:MAG: DUF819 domain-containing protein, partial [Pirellulaceae bacterium]
MACEFSEVDVRVLQSMIRVLPALAVFVCFAALVPWVNGQTPGSRDALPDQPNIAPVATSAPQAETAGSTDEAEKKSLADQQIDQIEELFPDDNGLVDDIEKVIKRRHSHALIQNDAIIFGILCVMLGLIFYTSNIKTGFWGTFYKIVPMLLVCYFLPSLLTFFEIVDHRNSNLYFVATRYLLPATLVLLTLSIDLREIFRLGPKALVMFLTGTVGVILGGPLAVIIVSYIAPEIIGVDGPEALWRGLSTVAGSWIGGGANQAAMQVIFMTPPEGASDSMKTNLEDLYSVMVAVDVFVAEIWMLFLLLGVGKAESIDRFLKADASSIERLQNKMEKFSLSVARIPTATDLMVIAALGFGATAVAHWVGSGISGYVSSTIDANESLQFLKDLG